MRLTLFVLMSAVAGTIAAGNESTPMQAPAAASQTQPAAAPAQEPRRRREVSPEERAKIEAALPAKAPALPKKPRKLLVFDRQGIYLGRQYGGHSSIPHANLAVQLMGEKTGGLYGDAVERTGRDLVGKPAAIRRGVSEQHRRRRLRHAGDARRLCRLRRQRRRRGRQPRHQRRLADVDRVRRYSWRNRRLAPRADGKGDDQHRRSLPIRSHARSTASPSNTPTSSIASGRRTRGTRCGCSSASIRSSPT